MSFGEKAGAEVKKNIEVKSKTKKIPLELTKILRMACSNGTAKHNYLGKENIPGRFYNGTSCQFFHKCRTVMSFYPCYTGFFSNVEEILLGGVHMT